MVTVEWQWQAAWTSLRKQTFSFISSSNVLSLIVLIRILIVASAICVPRRQRYQHTRIKTGIWVLRKFISDIAACWKTGRVDTLYETCMFHLILAHRNIDTTKTNMSVNPRMSSSTFVFHAYMKCKFFLGRVCFLGLNCTTTQHIHVHISTLQTTTDHFM